MKDKENIIKLELMLLFIIQLYVLFDGDIKKSFVLILSLTMIMIIFQIMSVQNPQEEINVDIQIEKDIDLIEKVKTGKVAIECENKEQSEIFLTICSNEDTDVITFKEFMKEYNKNRIVTTESIKTLGTMKEIKKEE